MTAFSQEPNRVPPALGAHQMQTYRIVSPLATHHRPATCEEVACRALEYGWRTMADERTPLGQKQAHYIRTECGRRFVELAEPDGRTQFVFESGQKCFSKHTVPLDRPELYLVQPGDWRGNPRGDDVRVHSGPDAWVDDLASHTQKFIDLQARG